MNLEQAAKYLGVPPIQLTRWAGYGVGPPLKAGHPFHSPTMEFDPEELAQWKASDRSKFDKST